MQSYAPLCKPAKIQTLVSRSVQHCNSSKRVLINLRKSRMGPASCGEPGQRMGAFRLLFFIDYALAQARITFLCRTFFASLCMFQNAKSLIKYLVQFVPRRKSIALLHSHDYIKATVCFIAIIPAVLTAPFPRGYITISVSRIVT